MLKIKFIPLVFLFSLTNLFSQAPALFVKGNTLQTIHNDTIMLRGASLGDLASQNYYRMGGKNALDMLDVLTDTSKGWYINLVRIPIHPDVNWGGDQTWPKINPVHFDTTQLRPFIDKATELGLYVMIDLHYVHNSYGIDGMGVYVDKRLRDFWKFIAPRYANYENVMYELFNEPIDDCQDWNSWVDRAQGWVDLIRSYAPNIIWVGAPCWSQQIGGSALKPIKGGNIGYVSHFIPIPVWIMQSERRKRLLPKLLLSLENGVGVRGNPPTYQNILITRKK
ncbi:MAG: glycoside hydrolase family 5 protein [Bacteroidales bacterium]